MGKPRVLVGWELGANLGHVSKIARLLSAMQDDVDLTLALREPWQLRRVAPDLVCTVLPAPYFPSRSLAKDEAQAASYAGILLTEGWDRGETLSGLVEAWRGLIATVRPDVVIAQAAPTFLLAARGSGLKTVVIGGGYDNPPLADPMPPFGLSAPDRLAEERELAQRQETLVRETANTVLRDLRAPAADRFCDLIRPDLSLLVSWDVNDHYGDRAALQPDHPPYLGPLYNADAGADVTWAGHGGARILAYLRPGSRAAPAGLKAVAALGQHNDVICAAPGLSAKGLATMARHRVQAVSGPVRLASLLGDCDVGITHASAGVAAAFLAAGVRQIGLPNHREQSMMCRAMARHGALVGIEGSFGPEAVIRCIETLRGDVSAAHRVGRLSRRIAQRYDSDPGQAARQALRTLIG